MGYYVHVGESGAKGLVEFSRCSAERTTYYGMEVGFYSADAVNVRFEDCTWTDVSTGAMPSPLCLEMPLINGWTSRGQVEFRNCAGSDNRNREFLWLKLTGGDGYVVNAVGDIDVFNPYGSAGWTRPPELAGLNVQFFD